MILMIELFYGGKVQVDKYIIVKEVLIRCELKVKYVEFQKYFRGNGWEEIFERSFGYGFRTQKEIGSEFENNKMVQEKRRKR